MVQGCEVRTASAGGGRKQAGLVLVPCPTAKLKQ